MVEDAGDRKKYHYYIIRKGLETVNDDLLMVYGIKRVDDDGA